MRHSKLVPPLPQDLQNRSFKGQDCQGWDFSGRDIRGCDFRKSNLRDADFTDCHAGRTKQQTTREKIAVPIGLILGITFAIVLMTAYKSPVVLTRESIDAAGRMATLTLAIGMTLMFGAVAGFQFLGLSTGTMAMTGGMTLSLQVIAMSNLINASSALAGGPTSVTMVILIGQAIFLPVFGVFYYRQTVKICHQAIGTDFQGANLSGANFTNAILKNCAFKQANLSQANWSNVETSRCDRDVTKLA